MAFELFLFTSPHKVWHLKTQAEGVTEDSYKLLVFCDGTGAQRHDDSD